MRSSDRTLFPRLIKCWNKTGYMGLDTVVFIIKRRFATQCLPDAFAANIEAPLSPSRIFCISFEHFSYAHTVCRYAVRRGMSVNGLKRHSLLTSNRHSKSAACRITWVHYRSSTIQTWLMPSSWRFARRQRIICCSIAEWYSIFGHIIDPKTKQNRNLIFYYFYILYLWISLNT